MEEKKNFQDLNNAEIMKKLLEILVLGLFIPFRSTLGTTFEG